MQFFLIWLFFSYFEILDNLEIPYVNMYYIYSPQYILVYISFAFCSILGNVLCQVAAKIFVMIPHQACISLCQ